MGDHIILVISYTKKVESVSHGAGIGRVPHCKTIFKRHDWPGSRVHILKLWESWENFQIIFHSFRGLS